MKTIKIPFWAWLPPYVFGMITSWLNHTAAKVTVTCWGLCVIILIYYFNHYKKNALYTEGEKE